MLFHTFAFVPPTEILKGGVKIIRNEYLSYAPQVNWLDIVKNESADIMIEGNGPKSESELWRKSKSLLKGTAFIFVKGKRLFPDWCIIVFSWKENMLGS